jgi:phosphoglucosamine mutase
MVEGVDASEVRRLAEWLADVVRAQIAPSSAGLPA